MSLKLIIVLIVVLAIFVGTLEQARIALRWKPKNTGGLLEAKRNTLRGELQALDLGIKQVQRYIDDHPKDHSEAAVKVAAEAQTHLDKAVSMQKEVQNALDKADTETALQICTLRLDTARFYVGLARHLVEKQDQEDDDDQQ